MTKVLPWLNQFSKNQLVEFLSELIPKCDYLELPSDEELEAYDYCLNEENPSEFYFDYATYDATQHPCYAASSVIREWYLVYVALDSDDVTRAFRDDVPPLESFLNLNK